MTSTPSIAALAARFSAVLLIASSCAACAVPLVDVQVIDRNSSQQATIHYHGSQRYVAGNPGERYAVRITNRTGQRVLAVLSVDGVNAVSGETAGPEQNGYVLAPYQSYDVPGWRKSQDEVAAFYFTSLGDSYAARTDRPRNVGVIGVAVWREALPPIAMQQPVPDLYDRATPQPNADRATAQPNSPPARERGDSATPGDHIARLGAAGTAASAPPPAPASAVPPQTASAPPLTASAPQTAEAAPPAEASAKSDVARPSPRPAPAEKLGTGHGERVTSRVEFVDFERQGSVPAQLVQIFYDSRANLIARGIIPDGNAWNRDPDPFPHHQFAPDPRG